MATEHRISATGRKGQGKGASRRLRLAGQVPAIVYGAHKDPVSIELSHHALHRAAENEWFYSAILDLDIDGVTERVILRDMQRHPVKPQIMHMDFQRIAEGEAMRVSVPLHFLNQERSPAGKTAGVVITHELNELEISCLPKDLPEFIEIDLSKLKVGDVVHLSEINAPNGVEIPELKLGHEHDVAVVIARHAKVEVDPEVEETTVAADDVPAGKVDGEDGEPDAADEG